MANAIATPSGTTTVVLWVGRILMAALFLFAAFAKLSGQQRMVEGFSLPHYDGWFPR